MGAVGAERSVGGGAQEGGLGTRGEVEAGEVLWGGLDRARPQAEPRFPAPEAPQPLSHSVCPVHAQRDPGRRPALPSPAPAIG